MSADARRVVLVGVTGLSASGKSTVAHSLARHLHSPLHPISLDSYFIAEACERLGTYDDYCTIDCDRLVRDLRSLRSTLTTGGDNWRERLLRDTPGLESNLVDRTSVPASTASGGGTPCVAGTVEAVGDGADASLTAHEAEEAQLRSHTAALCRTQGHVRLPDSCVFVVCEGFHVFSYGSMREADLFDVCVWVEVPPEVACRRRYFRTPRRHAAAVSYQARLERLWSSRTEERRQDLLTHLTAALGPASCASEGTTATATAVPSPLDWRGLLRAGVGSPFFPPAPGTGEGAAVLWEPSSGVATDVFLTFWESLSPRGTARASDDGGSPEAFTWKDYLAAVAGPLVDSAAETCASAAEAATAAQRYAEFRYWFFFEVVYYHYLFHPLQQRCVAECFPSGRPDRRVCTLRSTAETTREEAEAAVVALADELTRWGCSTTRFH